MKEVCQRRRLLTQEMASRPRAFFWPEIIEEITSVDAKLHNRHLPLAVARATQSLTMAKVLIIEDEDDIRSVLEYNLTEKGHKTLASGSGTEGLKLAREHKPELVLLDLMLPDLHGTEVCRAIRADKTLEGTKIIFLTAKGEEIDRVVGFELGADDYVVKPFSVRELMLRVDAILRRRDSIPPSATNEDIFEFGALRVDRTAHRVWVSGAELELTALEFKLLVTLFDRKNRVQSRTALLNDVWGIEADITTRTVDTHVKRLREKLGDACDYVETVRGVGYRFAESPEPRSA
jgi:two-component system, OmpR family, phosphate regulon response regulator PhoB